MSTFLENLPHAVEAKVHSRKGREEPVLIQVATDMAGEDRFEQRWLVVTSKRLMVLASQRRERRRGVFVASGQVRPH